MTGRIVILSGPSGVGKDTVLAAWTARNPWVRRVVATTTRAPRPGEEDGVAYTFVSRERFRELAEAGAFLEWKEVHGNFYATPLESLERMLAAGLIAVLKIDVQGALTAMELRPDALAIFLMPPSMEELERRIRSRATESEDTIQMRLRNAREEIEIGRSYHHRVVNDEIERCVDRLEALLA